MKNLGYILPKVYSLPRNLHLHNEENYGLIDVKADGWCGYYALGLINFLKYDKLTQPLDMFNETTKELNPKPIHHLMDIQEFGLYGLYNKLNIAIFTMDGEERYSLHVTYIHSTNDTWIFPILVGNGHYNILCRKRLTTYQIGFEFDEANEILGDTYIPGDETDFTIYHGIQDYKPIRQPLHWRQKKRIVKSILQMIPHYTLKNETYYIITIIDAWRPVQIPYILDHTLCCIITDCDIQKYTRYYRTNLRNHFTCGVVYVKRLNTNVLVWSRNTYRIQIGNPVDFDENLDLAHNDKNSFETLSSLCTFLLR